MPELDEDQLAEIRNRAKRQIRSRMRTLRLAHPKRVVDEKSARICKRLGEISVVREASSVALFWPISERHEVDLRAFDVAARREGKRIYYPFMDPREGGGYRTGFRRVDDVTELLERGRGFLEPQPDAPVAERGDVDVVVVPALAAAADGHRIGYGAGYYDATLPDLVPPARTVIVVFDFQLLAELPVEMHDHPADFVVSDARTLEID